MNYILENPLSNTITLYTKSTEKDEYGEPISWTVSTVKCAIFEGQKKTLNREGQEVLSSARIAVSNKPSIDSLVYVGESLSLTPPQGSQEIIAVSTIRNEWQEIEGYWIWL